jgi:hypothetical protein
MEKPSRRSFLVSAALTGVAPLVGQAMPLSADSRLYHQVYFWLKRSGNEADRKQLIAGLQTLRAIPVVRELQIGMPASTEKREVVDNSWDVSELMIFQSEADQKTYQDHPLHQAFVKKYEHLWQKVIVYDTLTL